MCATVPRVQKAAVVLVALVAACSNGVPAAHSVSSTKPSDLPSAPISSIVVDDYASGGTLTVPPGTEFGLELSGGGWNFALPQLTQDPYRLKSGPGSWVPDLGYLGPGNCDSASPCGGDGVVFVTTEPGYAEVTANAPGGYVFDLHLQVRNGPVTLDLQAVPIINEAISTAVTAPIGATVNVHLIGNWGPPQPVPDLLKLFVDDHLATSGVVAQVATARVLNESIYSYSITGKGGYALRFKHLDPSVYADSYTIGFDIR
jgi:hypothetical protein